jgi:RimJ/RimL family protein N-acetyltransferase
MPHRIAITELHTDRLRLRHFRSDEAAEFVALAGDLAVARMTSDIPYPFTEADAGPWLTRERGEERFAIEYQGRLIGGVGYFPRSSGGAELGFWLGREMWGLGFATEAAREVVRFGFEAGGVPAFSSSHFIDNTASERVLIKLGFTPIGQASMWCAARKSMVETMQYWLPNPSIKGRSKARAGRPWRALLDKVVRPALAGSRVARRAHKS